MYVCLIYKLFLLGKIKLCSVLCVTKYKLLGKIKLCSVLCVTKYKLLGKIKLCSVLCVKKCVRKMPSYLVQNVNKRVIKFFLGKNPCVKFWSPLKTSCWTQKGKFHDVKVFYKCYGQFILTLLSRCNQLFTGLS
jgi:hypothetical protein